MLRNNPGDLRLTQEVLKEGKINNKLDIAMDGEEALLYLKKQGRHSNVKTPDLILLDLNLPKKDGREVLMEIKNDPLLKMIPVIVLTTSEAEIDITNTYANHANCYITKPVDFEHFIRVIKGIEDFWLSIVKLPAH